jgi:hypothetical protein
MAYMGARTPYLFAWSAMPKSQKIQNWKIQAFA